MAGYVGSVISLVIDYIMIPARGRVVDDELQGSYMLWVCKHWEKVFSFHMELHLPKPTWDNKVRGSCLGNNFEGPS